LQNKKIPANPKIHDSEQNFNLLYLFSTNPKREKKQLIFHISKKHKEFANLFFKMHKIKNPAIALQPGASILAPYREWPKENFIKLADLLTEELKATVLIFEGPDEPGLAKYIISRMKNKAVSVKTTLKRTAAIIEKCNLMISTDSGLGHVAAARNTKAIALFGPANPVRTRPYGKQHKVIIKHIGCNPCIKYPFYSTNSHTKCKTIDCLKAIAPEGVLTETKKML
jgi:ADP-heptose:LPS heptosyltransferase